MPDKPKMKRGFALVSPERLREISSKGGKVTPNNFKNNPEFARIVGSKGGYAKARKRKNAGK